MACQWIRNALAGVSGAGLMVVTAVALAPIPAHAVTITTADGSGADAFVNDADASGDQSETNFGASTAISVKFNMPIGAPVNRKGYVRFDLTGIVSGSVTAATLSLVLSSGGGPSASSPSTFNVFGLDDGYAGGGGALGEDWGELAITWDNAPANNTASGTLVNGALTTPLGTFDVADPNASVGNSFDFTSAALLDFLNADTDKLVTLIITRVNSNFSVQNFASKENTSFAPPTLTLEAQFEETPTSVPEPGTLALLGAGLAVTLLRRRRTRP